ncbi:hypothetical protein SESBI_45750 [Sesbania bispinosa]|nr:hypothetical protein SESBI_45750 [Sesbania bispinosa]
MLSVKDQNYAWQSLNSSWKSVRLSVCAFPLFGPFCPSSPPPCASTTLQQPDPFSDSLHVPPFFIYLTLTPIHPLRFLSFQFTTLNSQQKPPPFSPNPRILIVPIEFLTIPTRHIPNTVDHTPAIRKFRSLLHSPKARRSFHGTDNDRLRRAQSDVTSSRSSPAVREKSVGSVNREPDSRVGLDDAKKAVAVPSCEPALRRLSNLERFLQAITPSVPAQYPSKRTVKSYRTCNVEFQPYFVLGDLWESFREESAYGAGVPLVLNDNDSVVQYYVPFLSGIQIYSQTLKPSVKSRQLGEDSDSDFRDSSSDGSSDCELERGLKYIREQRNLPHFSDEVPHWMGRLSLRDHHTLPQDGFSSDDGESVNSQGYLLFEYLERDPPYSREPLADKIMDLAFRFPELVTLRSCDILPSSWISVAWYPIYRIPTGPTLKDLDACFLTYHSLYTPVGGSQIVQAPIPSYPTDMDSNPKISLPVFGLASYKLKGSLWTSNGGYERQLASSLLQAADNRLRLLQVSHPDFMFFSRS